MRPLTGSEARTRDYAEIENLHKGGPIAIADYLIVNDDDVGSFNQKLSDFYNKFL